jgi:phosphatidylinositol N-acetylglucosaminyltransferase subunit A
MQQLSVYHWFTLPCRVVILSRLVYRKGVGLQVAIIPALCHRHRHLRFLIGGDGAMRGELEAMVARHGLEDRVRLVGAVRHEDTRELLVQGAWHVPH